MKCEARGEVDGAERTGYGRRAALSGQFAVAGVTASASTPSLLRDIWAAMKGVTAIVRAFAIRRLGS
ncbi:MAG: hypothetical protein WCD11_07900 [Solirubrobacteraceae bacterium]